jgi:hypothetical protein
MQKFEKEFIINLFETWRKEALDTVQSTNKEHLKTYYTGHAAGLFEAIHYLKHKHGDEK